MMPRKRPADDVIRDLLRFGFTQRDIADRFQLSETVISLAAKDLGIPRRPHGRRPKVNSAPYPWTRKMEHWLGVRA